MFEGYRDTIAYHLDLPCTWSSFNIYVLSREIAQHTNVCLSGEGMDELFGGYIRYLLLKHELALYDVEQLKLYDPLINRYLGRLEERYFRLINRSSSDFTASRVYQFVARVFQQFDPIHAMGMVDFYTTMQIMLHMNDRMGMAHGLEIRSAFLDHRLVTYAFCMPSRYKINGYVPKYIIRQVARNLIPRKVYERIDKRGFITPFNLWFGGNEGNEFDRSRYRQWMFEDWRHAFFGSVPSTSKSEG
jgi:asparagine synthase (glutamine-hydrolysing)